MSLVRNGRARLALALPRHRDLLRHIRSRELDGLFEAYAVAAEAIERHRRETPYPEEAVLKYEALCLDIQAEVLALLARLKPDSD